MLISGAIFNIRSKNKNVYQNHYLYYYFQTILDKKIKLMSNGSTYPRISPSVIENFQIPIPNDITKLKQQLTKLSKTHSKISDLTELIPQKESAICDLISELTSNGEEGVDWNEYKLGDVCTVSAGKYLKSYEKGSMYPIIGGGDISGYIDTFNNENEWVIHKDGVSKKIISYIKGKFLLNHHGWIMAMKNNISKSYVGYYILNNTTQIMESLNGSNQKGLNQEKFYSFKIKILKDKVLTKYKLQDKFDEVDKLKEELEETKKTYQEDIKKLMEPFKQEGINDEEDDNSSSKSTKSAIPEKKVSRTRKQVETETASNSDTETNSSLDTESDSDDEEAQLEKLGISKTDLIQFSKLTKDGSTNWFHYPTEKIFTLNNKGNKWVKGKTQLYNVYADEIEQIKEVKEVKEKHKKSRKSSKIINDKPKEKKNKFTKSNVVIDNSDEDTGTDLDELERELEGNK